MANSEEICARLCLLTRAGWEENLPNPLSRRMVRRLSACGALCSLVLRDVPGVEPELLERARVLMGRAKKVYACMQAYEQQGYSILLPSDEAWPQRLFALGGEMPQFLFVKGNSCLLDAPALALAGSRSILPETMRIAYTCGRQMADEGFTMVCGGAQGVDNEAQKGLLEAGGSLILVPAMPVHQQLRNETVADALQQEKLLIVCDTLPDEPFSAQKALSRNHTIYALGEAAIVVAARIGEGGSWQGAMDCLRGSWTDVYAVDKENPDMAGCRGLIAQGAKKLDPDLLFRSQLCTGSRMLQTQMLEIHER